MVFIPKLFLKKFSIFVEIFTLICYVLFCVQSPIFDITVADCNFSTMCISHSAGDEGWSLFLVVMPSCLAFKCQESFLKILDPNKYSKLCFFLLMACS